MYIIYHIGDEVINNQGNKFTITNIYKSDNGKMRFIVKSNKTGYIADICRTALYTGKYLDKLDTNNTLGICIGYSKGTGKYYRTWYAMWKRCYDKSHHAYKWYGQNGVIVCDRWRRLDYFIEDCKDIQGFDEKKFLVGDIQLDKDTFNKKLYSKETCVFLERNKNHNLTKRNKKFIIIKGNKALESFHVIKDCANKYHLDDSCITKCLKNKRMTHKGYKFKYV